MKKIILVLMLLPFFVTAQNKLSDSNYRIYSVKQGKQVTLKDLVADAASYDVVFYGEEHNDSVTHYLERKLLEMLYAQYGAQMTLSMEMFDRDVQPVMNEYLGGFIREKYFMKDARVWRNYRDYKPMIEFAKDKGMEVICANAPTRYTNLAGRKGELALMKIPEESKDFIAPLPYDTATGDYYKKLTEVPKHTTDSLSDTAKNKKDSIPAMPDMGAFDMVLSQSLWDATMAYSISCYLKKHKGQKVMQVNGRFHSDEGFAVVKQLHNYRPKVKTLIISTGTDENFPNIKWADHKKDGDYIIVTDPKVPKTFKE